MKRLLSLVALLLMLCASAIAKDFTLASPNGKLKVTVNVDKTITYEVNFNGQQLLAPSQISMTVGKGETWGVGSKLTRAITGVRNTTVKAQNYKKAVVKDQCNMLLFLFKGFSLEFRAYDEGMAYRFVSGSKKALIVINEQADMNYASNFESLVPYVRESGDITKQFHNSFENTYTSTRLSGLKDGQLIFLPYIVKADNGVKIVVSESDVENYPGMFVQKGSKANTLKATFAPFPKTVKQGGHNELEQTLLRKPRIISPWPSRCSSSRGASSACLLTTRISSTTTWCSGLLLRLVLLMPLG